MGDPRRVWDLVWQALAVCATLLIFVGSGYVVLQDRITTIASDTRLVNQHVEQLDRIVTGMIADQKSDAGENRTTLSNIARQLGDLRTDVAKKR